MKKLFAIVLALALALSISAFAETELETIVIGATPSPHAEILEVIVDDMAELGYDLQIQIFNDYNLPCPAVASGELDANYFAHIPFIDSYNASVSEDEQVVPVIGVHYEPFGIYSNRYESLDELPEGATVAIPNDASNQTRALFLLQTAGLITLPEDAEPTDEAEHHRHRRDQQRPADLRHRRLQLPLHARRRRHRRHQRQLRARAGLSPLRDAIFY